MIDVAVVATIADMLGETEPVPVAQIRRIVSVLGAERAQGYCQLGGQCMQLRQPVAY